MAPVLSPDGEEEAVVGSATGVPVRLRMNTSRSEPATVISLQRVQQAAFHIVPVQSW